MLMTRTISLNRDFPCTAYVFGVIGPHGALPKKDICTMRRAQTATDIGTSIRHVRHSVHDLSMTGLMRKDPKARRRGQFCQSKHGEATMVRQIQCVAPEPNCGEARGQRTQESPSQRMLEEQTAGEPILTACNVPIPGQQTSCHPLSVRQK